MKVKVAVLIVVLAVIFLFYLSTFPFSLTKPKHEIVVLGLDGATWNVITPLIEKVKMPNLAKMIDNGAYGNITSIDHLDSTIAWTVALTGVEEDKNGITNRFSSDLKVDTIWGILQKNNKSVVATYWPFEEEKLHPQTKTIEGLLLLNNPVFEFVRKAYYFVTITIPTSKTDKDLIYDFYMLDYKLREYSFLREKYAPDVFAIRFEEPERLQSYFWMYMNPHDFNFVDEDKQKKYGSVIEMYYENFDKFLGKLMEQKDATIMVVSNYGFKSSSSPSVVDTILINKILEAAGFLSFDYRGDADISASKAYITEEGLHEDLVVFINPKFNEGNKIKADVARMLSNVVMQKNQKKIFKVIDGGENRLILERDVDYKIDSDDNIIIQDKTYPIKEFLFRRIISGQHDKTGVIILYGKGIDSYIELEDATIYDVAPTLLQLNGLQTPANMKGNVLEDALLFPV